MVTAQSWPIFLYENFQVDPEDFEKGLFKSSLLLKVGPGAMLFTSSTNSRGSSGFSIYLHVPVIVIKGWRRER